MYRHHDRVHMHAYEGAAYIHAGARPAAKVLHHNVVVKPCNRFHRKRSASMQLRLYPYLLQAIAFHTLALNNKAAVKVLAALHGKIESPFLDLGQHRVHNGLCGFNA